MRASASLDWLAEPGKTYVITAVYSSSIPIQMMAMAAQQAAMLERQHLLLLQQMQRKQQEMQRQQQEAMLMHQRRQHMQQMQQDDDDDAGEPDAGGADTNWVMCSKCQVWRVVPDHKWKEIEAAGDRDWFCKVCTAAVERSMGGWQPHAVVR